MGGNQAKMHTGKMGGAGVHAGQPRAMNQMSRNQQMVGKHPQMGGQQQQKMQGGGNRPKPSGQQQQQQDKKKKGNH